MADNPENLRMLADEKLMPFDYQQLESEDCVVVYLNAIAPNNAVEFTRKNGIVYYINTSEKPHLNYPHVHARYSGDTISISLIDFSVVGRFKSKNKQKEAIGFVETNKLDLMELWKSIIS